ncbi:AGE family epimerase/isomerase [Spirosoma rhododendri]|uniref:N-acyl-D-glucosamine 2-epimerase n=1 Tax=Spirosoma rhododendri TaxID=2728024 RepID=A0A7L5DLZ5_9BACT|nr:AGE family epimerase/isomerase [Spirosoma rhododendri]QJD78223.1 N-acyl-D-glucosamine 2-epimerase [Spirosoma rhododendri]
MFTRRSATDTTASDLQKLAADYQQALLRQVLPFWLEHSPDAAYGGYFDWLTTTGAVIEGDKSVVRQAQQAYAFARLYNTVDAQPRWLDHARLGVTFLSRFAHGDRLHCYDQLDRLGHPVALATTNEPDAYTLMAYAQFHRATNEDEWAMLAKSLLTNVLADLDDARAEMMAVRVPIIRQGRYLRDWVTGVRAMLSSRHLLDDDSWKDGMANLVQGIQQLFVDRRTDTVRAYVQSDGGYINTPEGRRVDVGLTLQLTNALFDYCELVPNRKLAQQAAGWCLYACEQAWDETAGGLRNFVDHKTQPMTEPDGYRWAWVMVEGLLALSKSYLYTRYADCLKWLRRLHEYTFAVFPSVTEPGWHLAVDTNRQPVWPTKASPLVDCYTPMCNLADIARVLQRIR